MTYLSYPVKMKSERKPSKPATASHTSALWLRAARQASGLTQAEVARRLGVDQSQVARAESGRVELSAANLDRYLGACRYRLVAVPTVRATAVDLASEIRTALQSGEFENAVRYLIQLSDNLVAEDRDVAGSLAAIPGETYDLRFNAAIAGIIEWRLSERGLPIPTWVEATPALAEQWWIDDFGAGETAVADATPEPLRRRNVFIDELALTSI